MVLRGVEVLERYSNRDDLLKRLQKLHALQAKLTPRDTATPPTQLVRAQLKLSPDKTEQLATPYTAGASQRTLAREFGVHRTTVARHLDRREVARHPVGLTPEQAAAAVRLYAGGWSLARIGEHFGVTDNTVRDRLLETGVRTRGSWGRER